MAIINPKAKQPAKATPKKPTAKKKATEKRARSQPKVALPNPRQASKKKQQVAKRQKQEPSSKHPGGRPQTLTPEQIARVAEDFAKYIRKNEDPIIVGFTSSYEPIDLGGGKTFRINKDFISDHEEFSELRKAAIQKQEAYLQRGATKGELNATMCIFRLKQPQHGFKDKSEVDHTTGGDKLPSIYIPFNGRNGS